MPLCESKIGVPLWCFRLNCKRQNSSCAESEAPQREKGLLLFRVVTAVQFRHNCSWFQAHGRVSFTIHLSFSVKVVGCSNSLVGVLHSRYHFLVG